MVTKKILEFTGVISVETATDIGSARSFVEKNPPDLILIDINLNIGGSDGLDFLVDIRSRGYLGSAVVISGDRSHDQIFRAAISGANDFFVKSPFLELVPEVSRALNKARHSDDFSWCGKQAVKELGYLRSAGLSKTDIELLSEYAVDFPRYYELSCRVNRSELQIRKRFSRICRKLGVDGPAQLGRLITICAMFKCVS